MYAPRSQSGVFSGGSVSKACVYKCSLGTNEDFVGDLSRFSGCTKVST